MYGSLYWSSPVSVLTVELCVVHSTRGQQNDSGHLLSCTSLHSSHSHPHPLPTPPLAPRVVTPSPPKTLGCMSGSPLGVAPPSSSKITSGCFWDCCCTVPTGPSQLMSSFASECCGDTMFSPMSVLSHAKGDMHKWHHSSCSIHNVWKIRMWLTLKEITVWECCDYGLKSIREDMVRRGVVLCLWYKILNENLTWP